MVFSAAWLLQNTSQQLRQIVESNMELKQQLAQEERKHEELQQQLIHQEKKHDQLQQLTGTNNALTLHPVGPCDVCLWLIAYWYTVTDYTAKSFHA